MNESMLHSLMKMFAILVSINREALHVLARSFVETFLVQQFSKKLAQKYLVVFDEYTAEMIQYEKAKKGKKISLWSVKILGICHQIVNELHIRHRFMILLSLMRFSRYFADVATHPSDFSNTIEDVVLTVSEELLITQEEYDNCAAFIQDKFYNVPNRKRLLIINCDDEIPDEEIHHVYKENLPGQIFVLKIERADTYLFQYVGRSRLLLNGNYIFPRHVYFLPRGSSIRGEGITPIYYSDIVSGYIAYEEGHSVHYLAKNIEFHFKNSPNGIQKFTFQSRSGQLVGIIGGSGAGKSTLLKVLNGSIPPASGGIYINGSNLHRRNGELEGIIGYIPQDDLLVEELTVYQNLWFNARLCLDGQTPDEIHRAVTELLKDLDLFDARDLKVGSPLNKYISGGQRKRLNIALELIREPHILFVDEPTSGLSSTDSENVINLLKQQVLRGKLVVSTIHQPSSELFKQFDYLLVLDRGGYPVYSGNPIDGITYFKQLAERVDAGESECHVCGNTNPNEILQVIEERDVDEHGEFTSRRKTAPSEWYAIYREKIESKLSFTSEKSWIPYNKFMAPGKLNQYAIYFQRNLLAKLADRQFMPIALLVAPLLAVILGYFSKYVSGDGTDPHRYMFSQNENLPAYLFMSVVVALFLGLIIAAEEIIKDRRILERESFLHLSRNSYLLSKITLLFLLSGIQMLLFVLIGNLIMEIRGLTFTYWLILFSTACFANMLGLNISDGLKSVVAIYVIVPFLLVPQILLAGVIVKFDKLHYRFASHKVVPVAGDFMASRWAYEALAVNQYVNNAYQRELFSSEMHESNVTYDMQFLVPTLIQGLEDTERLVESNSGKRELEVHLQTVREGISSISLTTPYPGTDQLNADQFSPSVVADAVDWLQKYRSALQTHREKLVLKRDALIDSLQEAAGGKNSYLRIKRNYYNMQLADLMLNRNELQKIVWREGQLLRKMEPVYMYPLKSNGRSHFYASVKKVGSVYIPTPLFNILVLWLMTILLYLTLSFRFLRKTLDFLGQLRGSINSDLR